MDVYRPAPVNNCNQVFSRDVGFVIGDKIIVSNIIPDRQEEIDAYGDIYRKIHYKQIYNLPESVHVEGGDVILYKNYIFLGQYDFPDYSSLKTARTNRKAVEYLRMLFPDRNIVPLNLLKSDTDPYNGILHLDFESPIQNIYERTYGIPDRKTLLPRCKPYSSHCIRTSQRLSSC